VKSSRLQTKVSESRIWTPRKYQAKSVKFVRANPHAMLHHDPGLGKTSVMLKHLCDMQEAGEAETMLVVAPLQVALSVWTGEVEKFSDTFGHLDVSVVCGKKAEREERASVWADVYVVNYENMVWLLEFWENHKDFKGWVPDILVCDESTKLKAAYKSKRFRFLKPRLPNFKRRYCLTGTPMPHSMLDLWSQTYVCDLGNALDRRISAYRSKYFVQRGFGGYQWVLNPEIPDAAEQIFDAIAPICERLDKLDHLDLPELVTQDIYIELPKDVLREYVKMERHCVAEITGGRVVAANAAAATQKLRQMANGIVYGGVEVDDRFVGKVHDEKLKALCTLAEQLRDGALIVYEFTSEVEAIKSVLPQCSVVEVLGGSAPGATKTRKGVNDVIRRWNAGEVDFIILHPDAACHGLNLQDGGIHVIFFALSWKLEGYQQTIGRLWRDEKKHADHKIIVHHIIAQHTVDEDMVNTRESKDTSQRVLLDAMKERTNRHG